MTKSISWDSPFKASACAHLRIIYSHPPPPALSPLWTHEEYPYQFARPSPPEYTLYQAALCEFFNENLSKTLIQNLKSKTTAMVLFFMDFF